MKLFPRISSWLPVYAAVLITIWITLISIGPLWANSISNLQSVKKWFILLDYDPVKAAFNFQAAKNYDMAILNPDYHPTLEGLKAKMIIIAYLSLGQAADYRPFWPQIKDKTWIIGEDKNWKGAYTIDMRNEEWQSLVINQIIPAIIKQGFKGLMLDTLDSADYLQSMYPKRFAGAREAMINLVRRIHQQYPQLYLMSNNGFVILDKITPYLSAVLVEDIHSMVDFDKGGYKKVDAGDREYKVKVLKNLTRKYHLEIFNIDYVAQKDQPLIQECLRDSKKLGYKPYIAEKNLNMIYKN